MKFISGVLNRHVGEWLAVTATCVLVSVVAAMQGWLWRMDQSFYDAMLASMTRPAARDLVIIAIDDRSLAELGRWPWPRSVQAELVDRLRESGVRAAALDIPLDLPSRGDPGGDNRLAASLAAFGRAVLPVGQVEASGRVAGESLPIPVFAAASAALGHIDVELDPDGIARSVYLWEGYGQARHPQLGLALFGLEHPDLIEALRPKVTDSSEVPAWRRAGWLRIPFVGPPGSYSQVSFVDVLRGVIPPEVLRGKVVLVGATAMGLADMVPTPTSGSSRPMSGVEVHANVYDALRRGDAVHNLQPAVGAAVAAVLVIAMMAWMLLTEPRVAMFGAFLFSTSSLVLAWAGVHYGRVWFGPAAGVLGCLLAHPLWSWRRLEATQRYLDAELAALARESGSPGMPPVRDHHGVMDPLQRRLDIVRQATRQQRSVRRFIRDTLEYLPIGVVVMDRRGEVALHNRRSRFLLDGSDPDGLRSALLDMPWPGDISLEDGLPRVDEKQGAYQLELDGPKSRRMLVTIAGLADETGGRLGRVFGLADVSASYEAQRSREETMNFLSHDIRAPLASILTLVEAQRYDPSMAEIFVPRVEQYARSALDLADGLFRLVRAECVDPRQFAVLELAGLLEVAAEEVWALARAKAIRVEVDVRISLVEECLVRGDAALLQRAVVNLLTNAIKYSSANTRVGLSLSSEAGAWVIRVSDQGQGIPQEALPRLFRRFSRIQGRPGADPGGVGLGLLIVKTIAERHGGEVGVTSEEGRGSTFEIRVPKVASI